MAVESKEGKILIVEDDAHINQILYDGLAQEGYRCTRAYSGSEGLLQLERGDFQLIILDLMLPGLSGERFMQELKEQPRPATPVIVLTAKDQLDHKLNLFALGAVDYVTKPFSLMELVARIQVHIKRESPVSAPSSYSYKQLQLDSEEYRVTLEGREIPLTRQEYKIIELLVRNPKRVFTKQDLYELAWDEPYLGEDKTITVHISNIRNKFKVCSSASYIDTVWGIGFRMSP
ncbi:response regulator transcription factor [Paenibacillus sp. CAU 1782]